MPRAESTSSSVSSGASADTAAPWQRVKAIYFDALELSGVARESFIVDACGDDVDAVAQVRSLLRAEEEDATGRLNASGFSSRGSESLQSGAEGPGMAIGPYTLGTLLGEGGFGAVYLAEQKQPIARSVALKILKLGMDTRAVIARFEAERQTLAMLEHPNIARVIDAGATPRGRPFFVMELVRGQRITDFCDEARLSVRERIELLIPACRAIQHAHSRGIIHRDLKPGNVLVTLADGKATPKVIDFGIAKAAQASASEATLVTSPGSVIGTPAYMSPEQARLDGGDVDTRSDVYSLGVLMYELLTGTTPLDPSIVRRGTFDQVLKAIRETPAPRPSTRIRGANRAGAATGPKSDGRSGSAPGLSQASVEAKPIGGATPVSLDEIAARRGTDSSRLLRAIRGELDWIALKAIEKDRTRRYDTASAFADDLERFLRGAPVLAAPPNRAYLAKKFIARNRVLVGAAVAVLLTLIAGIVGTGVGLLRAKEAARQAEASGATEREVSEFVLRTLSGTTPSAVPGRDTRILRDMLDDAVARLDKGAMRRSVAAELRIRSSLFSVYDALGEPQRGLAVAMRSREIALAAYPASHPEVVFGVLPLAHALSRLGRPAEATAMLRTSLAQVHARGAPAYDPFLSLTLHAVAADHLWTSGASSPEEVESLLDQAAEICAGLASRPFGVRQRFVFINVLRTRVLSEQERHEEAIAAARRAVAAARELAADGPAPVRLALETLADALESAGDADAAHEAREEAMKQIGVTGKPVYSQDD